MTKRNAWSIYLFARNGCNFSNSQGGYSAFGSFGCTTIFSDSIDFDPQGCTAWIYSDPSCGQLVNIMSGSEQCFGVEAPVGGALQSFKVQC